MPVASKVACVEIGGIPISLATTNNTFYDLLIQRYQGFLAVRPPSLNFSLTSSKLELIPTTTSASAGTDRNGGSSAATFARAGIRAPAPVRCARMQTPIPSIRSFAFCIA